MDFALSDEQNLFRDSVARFLAEELPFDRRQAIVAAEPGYREEHWASFAELGWLAASLPEEHGGLDGGPEELAVIMEQFGRGLAMSPYFASAVLGARALVLGGSPAQQADVLPALAEGRLKLALAHEEAQSRYDLADVATTAKPEAGGFRLDGAKSVVLYGGAADRLLVSARSAGGQRDAEGLSLFLVPRDAPGVICRPLRTQDGGRAAELTFEGVTLGPEALVGPHGGALPLLEAVADHGCAALMAEALGAMWAVYEQTLDYLKTRKQFGQTLGSFQVMQHRMVDIYMQCQLAQSLVTEATLALTQPDPVVRGRAVSAAKYRVGTAARTVGLEGVQLHGGIGMTMDLPIGHYLKRITAINATLGDPAFHLARYRRLDAEQ